MVSFPKNDMGMALCAWLNSTFSILFLRAIFTVEEHNYGHIYGWHLQVLPIPNIGDEYIQKKLKQIFDKYKNKNWLAIPEQYKKVISNDNNLRLEYDMEILSALVPNIDQEKAKEMLLTIYIKFLNVIK